LSLRPAPQPSVFLEQPVLAPPRPLSRRIAKPRGTSSPHDPSLRAFRADAPPARHRSDRAPRPSGRPAPTAPSGRADARA
jgi:hypothetical protein